MKGEGDYILSGVKLWKDGRPILDATPATKTIRCLGQVLVSSVSSTPMTLQEIKDSGIQLGQDNYEGRRFTMALSIGSHQVTLTVPVAVPVYNGVRTLGEVPTIGRMELTSLGGEYPGDISVVAANLAPPPESFNLGRPQVEHVLQHAFKAFLVIPGSIGYLHQYYKADVVVFNALGENSPYRVSHLKATFKVPPGKDGAPGTPDDPLRLAIRDGETDAITKSLLGNDNLGRPGKGVDSITGGQSAMATYYVEGLKEGSHPLEFRIEGQFEGGDLQTPVPIQGTASGKLLVRNPTFSLVLVHPDVVRRGEIYTMEARLTNTSGTLANDVSITIDKARLGNVKLADGQDPTQRVNTLLPGETTSFKFQFKALKNGEVRGSYLYMEEGTIGYQLTTGIGERNIRLNPDTLELPTTLDPLPQDLREAMLRVLGQAYSVATSRGALPAGVLPIKMGTVTGDMANLLSEQGLFMAMGTDKGRIWWDLWKGFMENSDPGFDQLVRTTDAGHQLRKAFISAWSWAESSRSLPDRLQDLSGFGYGTQGRVLVAIQGGGPGLVVQGEDGQGQITVSGSPLPQLPGAGSAWGEAGGVHLFTFPLAVGEAGRLRITNASPDAQTLGISVLSPVANQTSPSLNRYSVALGSTVTALFDLGQSRDVLAKLMSQAGAQLGGAHPDSTVDVPAEPFQVIGVHRWDRALSAGASPYGTQVMILFNRPTMPLNLPSGPEGLAAAQALVGVEANQPWFKAMGPIIQADGTYELDAQGNPKIASAPPALTNAFPRVASLVLEKPVGPYVARSLTVTGNWQDLQGNAIQGRTSWPIVSSWIPGGAVVRGKVRKLDGTGVPTRFSYYYSQFYDRIEETDVRTGSIFLDEGLEFLYDSYHALVSNNIQTEADGSYQLDFVPEPVYPLNGPFTLDAQIQDSHAFARAMVLGNGQDIQMDLVLEGKGSVEGTVIDAQGAPIPDVEVDGVQEQQTISWTSGTGGGTFQVHGKTDGNGHYRLDNLKTGVYSIRAMKGLYGVAGSGEIAKDGAVAHMDLVLKGRTGRIRARLLDLQGQPVLDQAIRLGFKAGLIDRSTTDGYQDWVFPEEHKPDADGWARFADVPAGDVQLVVPGILQKLVTNYIGYLQSDQDLDVVLRKVSVDSLAMIKIVVKDANGAPVQGAYVTALPGHPQPGGYASVTGPEGFSDIIQVQAGSQPFRSWAYHPSWMNVVEGESVLAEGGKSYVLHVTLPAKSAVQGRVLRTDGTPVKDAYVAIPPVYDDANKNRMARTDANGNYRIPSVPLNQTFRIAAVGPDLETSDNHDVVAAADTTTTVNFTLSYPGRNVLQGIVYQPQEGAQRIPAMATVDVYGMLPSIVPIDTGNPVWGLMMNELRGSVLSLPDGTFRLPSLPIGAYRLEASNPFFPTPAVIKGSFDAATNEIRNQDITLIATFSGELKGRVYQRDGQTPVAAGARVAITGGSVGNLEVTTQAGGVYKFAKVIPAGDYTLRVEDPATGDIFQDLLRMNVEQSQIRNIRLWGKGTLKLHVEDSLGQPLQNGVLTLHHEREGVLQSTDFPTMAERLRPEHKGLLLFEDLLEGRVSIELKDPNGLSGRASAEIPIGGGDVEVTVRLQPVGNVRGLLRRADGSAVPAGRVDAYLGGNWLGTSPTFQENVEGRFLFVGLPAGTIRFEAYDPDTRQIGTATVNVLENQTTDVELKTHDKGPVEIQVLLEGAPVLKAGVRVWYLGGGALPFSAEATTDSAGKANFQLPPGNYRAEAVDPVTLSTGHVELSRADAEGLIQKTLALQPVRTLFVTVTTPAGAPTLAREGWKVKALETGRTAILDIQGQGFLQDLTVGNHKLQIVDDLGRFRGEFVAQVLGDGPAIQAKELLPLALGRVKVTVLTATGGPVPDQWITLYGGLFAGTVPVTDQAGQTTVIDVRQGQGGARIEGSGIFRGQTAFAPFELKTEGELVQVTLTMAPTGSIAGTVRDPQGNPVPFMAVALTFGDLALQTSATDGNGAYQFSGILLNQDYWVSGRSEDGRRTLPKPIRLTGSDVQVVDLDLQAIGKLRVHFTDPLRSPMPTLTVSLVDQGNAVILQGSSDVAGRVEFGSVPAQDLKVRATWDDGKTIAFEEPFRITQEGQLLDWERTLAPFVHVKGWTKDEQGRKIPMTVILRNDRGDFVDQAVTTGDLFDPDHPTFAFRYLRAGAHYTLTGYRETTTIPIAFMDYSPAGTAALETVELLVPQPRTVRLQLRYPNGDPAPVAGVNLTLKNLGPLAPVLNGVTQADGSALVQGLLSGPYTLHVENLPWDLPFDLPFTVVDQTGEQALGVPIRGVGTLRVKVWTDAGRALSDGQIVASVYNKSVPFAWDGVSFVATGLPIDRPVQPIGSGFYLGARNWAIQTLVRHGEDRQVDVFVPSLGTITGVLRDADGLPLSGAPLSLFAGSLNGVPLAQVVTDGSGSFRFERVPAGSGVTIFHEGADGDYAVATSVIPGDAAEVQVQLQKHGLGTVDVAATTRAGQALAGIQVTLSSDDGRRLAGTTNDQGMIRFVKVPAGSHWTAAATLPHALNGSMAKPFVVQKGQTTSLVFADPAFVRVKGPIRRLSGKPFPLGTQLMFSSGLTLNVQADGSFVATEMPLSGEPATLLVRLNGAGFLAPLEWTVPVQLDADLQLDAVPAFGTLKGRVLKNGVGVIPQSLSYRGMGLSGNLSPMLDGSFGPQQAPVGIYSLEAHRDSDLGWAQARLEVDGDEANADLDLSNAQVTLPVNLPLDRLQLSAAVNPGTGYIPGMSWSVDGASSEAVVPATVRWLQAGTSLTWDEPRGDVNLTRVVSTSGYGLRQELIFTNQGTSPKRVALRLHVGAPTSDLKMGTADAKNGGVFQRDFSLAWVAGTYAPSDVAGEDLIWSELVLQPGESKGFFLGHLPYGKYGYSNLQPTGLTRALSRVQGQAPEWTAGLDARTNLRPEPTLQDVLAPWAGTASIRILDPTGQPVEATGVPIIGILTPLESLAPTQTWTLTANDAAPAFAKAAGSLPPDGAQVQITAGYGATPNATALVTPGASVDMTMMGMAVLQVRATDPQRGTAAGHSVQIGGIQETLQGDLSHRRLMVTGFTQVTLRHSQNSNLFASVGATLQANQLQLVDVALPANGSVTLHSAQSLGALELVQGNLSAVANWDNGAYTFPAVAAGPTTLRWNFGMGAWKLDTFDVVAGAQERNLPMGNLNLELRTTAGALLPVSLSGSILRDGIGKPFSGFANPSSMVLPVGTYAVQMKDPRTGAIHTRDLQIADGQATPWSLSVSLTSSLQVHLQATDGSTAQATVQVLGADGSVQSGSGSNGIIAFPNVVEGPATVRLVAVPGASPEDAPADVKGDLTIVSGQGGTLELTYPKVISTSLRPVNVLGDPLPAVGGTNQGMGIAKQFNPGMRWNPYGDFQGVRPNVPLAAIYTFDGLGLSGLNASQAVTPTVDGQVLTVTFPLGRLRFHVLSGGQPKAGASVTLNFGNGFGPSGSTDGDGWVVFPQVPLGLTLSYTVNGGVVPMGGSLTFTGPTQDQVVEVAAAANLHVQVTRANGLTPPAGGYWDRPWSFTLKPANGVERLQSSRFADMIWPDLSAGAFDVSVSRPVGTQQSGDINNTWPDRWSWSAKAVVNLDGQNLTPTVSLQLPALAAWTLNLQNASGQAPNLDRALTLRMTSSSVPGYQVPVVNYYSAAWNSPTLTFGEHFPEGQHTFVIEDGWFGELSRFTLTVQPQDDGSRIQQTVQVVTPKAASLTLHLRDLQGRVLSQGHSLSLRVLESTMAGYHPTEIRFYESDPILPQAFPVGSHRYAVIDEAFGEVGQFSLSVAESDDSQMLERTVALNYIRAHWSASVVAGDHETPVPTAWVTVSAVNAAYSANIPVDGIGMDLEVVPGYAFHATGTWDPGTGESVVEATGLSRSLSEGENVEERLELPLTVVRALLLDQDGVTPLNATRVRPESAAPISSDNPTPQGADPMLRDEWRDPQGRLWALNFGTAPGLHRFRVWDAESGLGQILETTVPPVGNRAELQAQMPAYAWVNLDFQVPNSGNEWHAGLPLNTPGLAAPWHGLAEAMWNDSLSRNAWGPRKVPTAATTLWGRTYRLDEGGKSYGDPSSVALTDLIAGQTYDLVITQAPLASVGFQVKTTQADGTDWDNDLTGTLDQVIPDLPYEFHITSAWGNTAFTGSNPLWMRTYEGQPFRIQANGTRTGRLWQGHLDLTFDGTAEGTIQSIALQDVGPAPALPAAGLKTSAKKPSPAQVVRRKP